MAQDPREQQQTDAERIGEHGTGKLDDTKEKDAVVRQHAEEPDDGDDAVH
ncbi:MAG: hypothetical protein FJ027_20850 [Candidatus Rokubacteria bacterium]|nr:hypothetical protein [Candidatus Rokubacteria bacterium]